jgi:hypothetical protein
MDGSNFAQGHLPPRFSWTSRADDRLRSLWVQDIPGRRVAAIVGCSYKAVRVRAIKLGLPRKTRKEMRWTPEMVDRLRAEIGLKKSARLVARDMDLTHGAIVSKATSLGLRFAGKVTLPRRPSTANPTSHRRNIEEAKERAAAIKGQRCVWDQNNPLQEPKGCLWPIGDMHTPSWRFCQEAVMTHHPDGREARHPSYCTEHRGQAYWSPSDEADAEGVSSALSSIRSQ